ncbi:hypothetical protein H8R23_03920 [Flavobacterium sp. F-380]|uniref:Uncharacterized protein n=1 Tax=Flavobacterium kayseriense TaxID=2764714 RepID=A0ABR7J4S5_9FLAO|nr:hypothetical protein [Flavobacterium kayseriense]MBC5846787.1 hypothetical protein [Flavobacterium kayseriense]MBU0942779.1 hypothetical protein [Bacteroidota bacterium]
MKRRTQEKELLFWTVNMIAFFVLLRNEASLINEQLEGIPPTSEGQNEGKDLRK